MQVISTIKLGIASFKMSDAHSNVNEDIYEDLDVTSEASPSTNVYSEENGSMDVDAESDDLFIVKEILTSPKEAELRKAEKKLYLELLNSEKEKRKEEKLNVSDYDEIKKQLIHLQKVISEKDVQIADLKKQTNNLQMNICSLYKTAKSDSNQKDILLREANGRVDDLLFKRNLPRDYFEKLSSLTLIQKHCECSQKKSSEDITGSAKSSQHRKEINCQSKGGSDIREKNLNQSSGQHKRSHSPTGDVENPTTRNSTYSNKRQHSDSNDIQNTTRSGDKISLNINEKSDSNTVPNTTSLVNDKNLDRSQNSTQNTTAALKTESLERKENCDLNSLQNTACIDDGKSIIKPISDLDSAHKSTPVQSESLNKNQNPDLDNEHIIQSDEKDPEPSVEELFFQMQLMISNDPDTLNDPDTVNLIFDNLLPDELKQWFLVYESSQTNALNKLKQSFVNSYFQQCSANTAGSSKVPEEKSAKPQNFPFFFQQNSSCSKTDCEVGMPVLDEGSVLKNEPHGNTKVIKETSS